MEHFGWLGLVWVILALMGLRRIYRIRRQERESHALVKPYQDIGLTSGWVSLAFGVLLLSIWIFDRILLPILRWILR